MTSSKSSDLRSATLLALVFLLLACSRSATPPNDADRAISSLPPIRDYLEMVGSSAGHRLPDGSLLFLSRGTGEVSHLYLEKEGNVRQLTSGTEPTDGYAVAPGGRALLFLSSKGGNEQNDIFFFDLTDGSTRALLADPEVRYDHPVWIDDGRFLFAANEVSRRDFYLYLYDVDSGRKKLLVDRPGTHVITDAKSPDQFLFYTMLGSTVTLPYRYENGKLHKLKGAREDRYYLPVGYWNDGRILLVTDEANDIASLVLCDRRGRLEMLSHGPWPIEEALLDRVSREETVFCANENGWSTCRHLHRGITRKLDLGRGVITLDHLSDGKLAYTISRPDEIPRPVLYDLRSDATRDFGLTDARGIATDRFIAPEVRAVRSFDGENIPYLVYLPHGAVMPYRTIVHFHGGPEGQSRPSFAPIFQYYLTRKFAVVLPNVRGSTGYGRRFSELDNYTKRMDAVKDVGPVLDALVRDGVSRPDRFIAWGGSYGGFMTVAAMAFYPDRFRCGVDVVGIADFINFLKNTRSYRKALQEAEYGPLEDETFLRSISPTSMADRIKGRMFIAHGANDPRVPVSDAYILADRLRASGNLPDMLIFDDEGHGFRKKKNRILFNERAASFIEGCATNL